MGNHDQAPHMLKSLDSLYLTNLSNPYRGRKVLENRGITDEERILQLEKELEETILLGEEADRNYEEVTAWTTVFIVCQPA